MLLMALFISRFERSSTLLLSRLYISARPVSSLLNLSSDRASCFFRDSSLISEWILEILECSLEILRYEKDLLLLSEGFSTRRNNLLFDYRLGDLVAR